MIGLKNRHIALPIFITSAIVASNLTMTTSAVSAKQIQTYSKKNRLSTFRPSRTIYGKLRWKGGISVSSSANGFGGLSGLALSNDGKDFIAISDRGWWVKGSFILDKNQYLSGIKNVSVSPLKILRKSKQNNNHWLDSEALAPWGPKGINGDLLVGFERRERILRYQTRKN